MSDLIPLLLTPDQSLAVPTSPPAQPVEIEQLAGELLTRFKHLGAQHDQATHGNRGLRSQASPGGSAAAGPYAPSANSYAGWSQGTMLHFDSKTKTFSQVTALTKDGLGIYKVGKRFEVHDAASQQRLGAFVSLKQAQLFAGVLQANHDFEANPMTDPAASAQVKQHIGQMLVAAGLKPNSSNLQAWGTQALAQAGGGAGKNAPAKPERDLSALTSEDMMGWYNRYNVATYNKTKAIPHSDLLDKAVENVIWGRQSKDRFVQVMNEKPADDDIPPAANKKGSYSERMMYGLAEFTRTVDRRANTVEVPALSRLSGLTRNEIDAAYSYQGMSKFMQWEARFGLDQMRLHVDRWVSDPKKGLVPVPMARSAVMKQLGYKDPGKFYDYILSLLNQP